MFILMLFPLLVIFIYIYLLKNKKKNIHSISPINCNVDTWFVIDAISPTEKSNNCLKSILGDAILKKVEYNANEIIYYFCENFSGKEVKVSLESQYDLIPDSRICDFSKNLVFSKFTTSNYYYHYYSSNQIYVGLEFVSEDGKHEYMIQSYHKCTLIKQRFDIDVMITKYL